MIFLEYKRRFYDLSIFATTPPYRAFFSKVASGWALTRTEGNISSYAVSVCLGPSAGCTGYGEGNE